MATLYTTASRARMVLLLLLVFAVLAYLWDNFGGFGEPPVVRLPRNSFYLDPQNLPTGINLSVPDSAKYTYNSTATFSIRGTFSQFPDVAYVHYLDQPGEKLDSVDKAKDVAKDLGFVEDGYTLQDSGNEFVWSKDINTKTLNFNKVTKKWRMTTRFVENADANATKRLYDEINDYKGSISNILSQLGFTADGMADGGISLKYTARSVAGIFSDVENSKEADYVFADVYRQLRLADLKPENLRPAETEELKAPPPVEGKVYKLDPRQGSARFIVSNTAGNFEKDIFLIDYQDYTYTSKVNFAIITPDEAWDEVQSGRGNLMLLIPRGGNYFGEYSNFDVSEFITEGSATELGYFEPEYTATSWTGLVYPIYIFRGTAITSSGQQLAFVFYVDALKRFGVE